jgi:hypothetical protein
MRLGVCRTLIIGLGSTVLGSAAHADSLLVLEAASYTAPGRRTTSTLQTDTGERCSGRPLTTLRVDGAVFTAGLAAANASREAQSFTIAANWYPTAYIKY